MAYTHKNEPNYMRLDDSGTFLFYLADLSAHFYHKEQNIHKNHRTNIEQQTFADKPLAPR